MAATTLQNPASSRSGKESSLLQALFGISICHGLNDTVQSLLPSVYPMLKGPFHLSFGQIGMIVFVNQVTASLLQPFVGHYTDRRPVVYSLPIGMTVSLAGLLLLAVAGNYGWILLAAALVGVGSAVFHPESSRVARMASGGQHGLAQSVFQLGGSTGTAIGPLLAAFLVLPHGQRGVLWFGIFALTGILLLVKVSQWAKHRRRYAPVSSQSAGPQHAALSKVRTNLAIGVLVALVASKFLYLASLNSYYTFYLIHRFHVSVRSSQLHLFLFLGAAAAGTFLGGPIGDRIGRKRVIWVSIMGALPFSLLLPYVNLAWTGVLSAVIGFVIASAFPAIVVYGQELLPGRVGMVSGLFFGLAFGVGGVGAALLGKLADLRGIEFVYYVCAWLPAIGLLTALLPDIDPHGKIRVTEIIAE